MARWYRRRVDVAATNETKHRYSHFGINTRESTNKSQIAASQPATSTMITAPMMILPHTNGSEREKGPQRCETLRAASLPLTSAN